MASELKGICTKLMKTPNTYTLIFKKRELGDLKLSGNGVLVHVNIVFVDGVHNKLITFRLHPSSDKRCQVQPWVPIKHQLIVYDLERCLLWYRVLRHLVPAHIIIYPRPAYINILYIPARTIIYTKKKSNKLIVLYIYIPWKGLSDVARGEGRVHRDIGLRSNF